MTLRPIHRIARSLALSAILAAGVAAAPEARAQSPFEDLDAAGRAALHEEIRSYLLENPEILVEMYSILEAREQEMNARQDAELLAENEDRIYDDGFSYAGGNPNGDITIVEFLDYQCGYCRKASPEVTELLEEDGNIRWIVKEFPILGPGSELAARAAISTLISEGDTAYARLHETLMTGPGQVTEQNLDLILRSADLDPEEICAGMNTDEVTQRIRETRDLGATLGISGTPTFVLAGEMVRGYVPIDQMRALVAAKRMQE